MELRRDKAMALVAGLFAAGLLAILLARGILREVPGSNVYAALADALMHGRLYVEGCPAIDCAVFQGRTYIIFPPFPAVVAMPFVALVGFKALKGFILLASVLTALALYIWSRIFRALSVEGSTLWWLLLALAFASPLYQVVARSDGVWFFAQALGFLMVTLSIWAVLCRNSLPLAGVFIALAFLCRQMTIFIPFFLVFLAMEQGQPFWGQVRRLIRPVLLAAIPVLAALCLIFVYNYARFGHPLETGYGYIVNPGVDHYISRRIQDLSLFSREYLQFNVIYLFLQGVHFEFTGPYLTQLTGFDKGGTALLVASPWLLLAVYARIDRVFWAGMVVIGIIAGITLFYHGNGSDQINTHRFTLDWLPVLLVLMLRGERHPAFAALPALVTWGVASNAIVVALVALYRF